MNDHIENTENIHNKLVELEDHSKRNNINRSGFKGGEGRGGRAAP